MSGRVKRLSLSTLYPVAFSSPRLPGSRLIETGFPTGLPPAPLSRIPVRTIRQKQPQAQQAAGLGQVERQGRHPL